VVSRLRAAPAGTIAAVEFEPGGPHVVTDADAVASAPTAVVSAAEIGDPEGADPEGADPEGADPVGDLDIDESVLDAIENDLADVERALALLDEGTYGQCEVCGRLLEDAVLAQAPATRFCPDHLPLSLPRRSPTPDAS
jgi:hypothetical protein